MTSTHRLGGSPEAAEAFNEMDLVHNRIDAQVKLSTLRFLIKCTRALEMNCNSLATAARLFHEFLLATRHAKAYDPQLLAMACIQLAAKVEEQQHVRTRDIVNVAHRIAFANSAPLEYGSELERIRESVARCELLLCRTLKFHVRYTHPYIYLAHYLANVFDWSNESDASKRCASRVAFAILNDSYLTELCLTESPPRMAVAAMHSAFALTNFRFPASDSNWWTAFEPTVTVVQLNELACRLLHVYDSESAAEGAKETDSDSETETSVFKCLAESSSGGKTGEKVDESKSTKRKRETQSESDNCDKRRRSRHSETETDRVACRSPIKRTESILGAQTSDVSTSSQARDGDGVSHDSDR